ncbi:hypothetical protein ACFXON_25075, partial [Bacillus subtilis]
GALDEALAANYFPELASHILGGEAWGLIAAVLGNMANRSDFSQRFWWGKDSVAQPRPDTDPAEEPADDGVLGMQRLLARAAADPATAEGWRTAREAFRSALSEVRELAAERQGVADDIAELARLTKVLETSDREIRETEREYERRRTEHARAEAERDAAEAALRAAREAIEEHKPAKPGFWKSLRTLFRNRREWRAQNEILLTARRSARLRSDAAAPAVTAAAQAWEAIAARGRQLLERHAAAVQDHEEAARRVDQACERWRDTVPFGPVLNDEHRFQLCNAWADEQFTAARHRLFLQALCVHRAFAFDAAPQLRGNLAVLSALLRGPLDPKPSA